MHAKKMIESPIESWKNFETDCPFTNVAKLNFPCKNYIMHRSDRQTDRVSDRGAPLLKIQESTPVRVKGLVDHQAKWAAASPNLNR